MNTDRIREQFPILNRTVEGPGGPHPLVFMDHGASTQAPTPVLDAVMDLHTKHYANIHRGNHALSLESSDLFDEGEHVFADFIGANAETGCFVMGGNTTDSLSLAAHIIRDVPGATATTIAEHHSNDLPHRRAGKVLHAEVDEFGRVDMDHMESILQDNEVKLLAVTGASNVTGYFPPIYKLARMAHDNGARILVDAAQLYAHDAIDVRADDHPEHIDFLAAAGHKAYSPFGSSFLYGPQDLMDAAPPFQPGGGTVDWVTGDDAWFTKSPDRHMGGTPNITGVVAFAAATKWLKELGMDNVREHERELTAYGLKRFAELEAEHDVELFGPRSADEKAGVFSFLFEDVRHEVASKVLSSEFGIATRNGCFCAHPLLHRLLKLGDTSEWTDALSRGEPVQLPGATRATIGIYQTKAEVDLLFDALDVIGKKAWKGNYTADPTCTTEVS
ncbi:MAG: aminotransferase class V-fold PLP-dependent enzyme [Thermoplasmatota archaeon]